MANKWAGLNESSSDAIRKDLDKYFDEVDEETAKKWTGGLFEISEDGSDHLIETRQDLNKCIEHHTMFAIEK